MISRKNPKIPKLIAVMSKPMWMFSLIHDSTKRSIIDSAIAPRMTPQMLPIPPMITMHRMKTENPNSNWSTLTVFL